MGIISYMLLNLLISTQYGTRLTWIPNNLPLEYESLPHCYTRPQVKTFLNTSTSQTILLKYRHYIGTHLSENSSGRLSIQGLSCTRLSRSQKWIISFGTTRWKNRGRKISGKLNKNET